MLRSDVFSKASGILGILSSGIALGYFVVLSIMTSIIWLRPKSFKHFLLIWYFLIAQKLFKLGKIEN